jgi:hypothetical protein
MSTQPDSTPEPMTDPQTHLDTDPSNTDDPAPDAGEAPATDT